MATLDKDVERILAFWFGGDANDPQPQHQLWWNKDAEMDKYIADSFGELHGQAAAGELANWQEQPKSCLALIILLDQFSRNIYRNQPESFAQDSQAIQIVLATVNKGLDKQLSLTERYMMYMPYMHSEDLGVQKASIQRFKELVEENTDPEQQQAMEYGLEFAVKHHDIIARFSRYPHRNIILSRESTPDEIEFLKEPGSSF